MSEKGQEGILLRLEELEKEAEETRKRQERINKERDALIQKLQARSSVIQLENFENSKAQKILEIQATEEERYETVEETTKETTFDLQEDKTDEKFVLPFSSLELSDEENSSKAAEKLEKVHLKEKGRANKKSKTLSVYTKTNVSRIQEDCANTFDKRKGFATVHGVLYEVKMCMFVFLKLLNLKANFSLCSNLEKAGDIDDVVVHYNYKDEKGVDVKGALFIQLKHSDKKDNRKSITFYKRKPDFKLLDFFLSFSLSDRTENHDIFSCDLDKRFYLIFTNAAVDMTLLSEDTEFSSILDDLKCCKFSKVLKLKKGEEYEEFSKFVENLSKVFDDSSENQEEAVKEINNCIDNGQFIVKSGKSNDVSSNRSLGELKAFCDKYKDINFDKIDDFFLKMRICCCQANVDMLNDFINHEIKSSLTVSQVETETVFTKLRDKFTVWHDSESYYLTQYSKIWADISKETRDVRPKNIEMENLGVKFNDDSISSLIEIIERNRFLNIVSQGDTTTLSSLKVWQALEYFSPQSYLLVSITDCLKDSDDIWKTWPARWCKTLVIEFDADYDDSQCIKDQVISWIGSSSSSKVILITSQTNKFVTDNITNISCMVLKDDANFNQLDENSQTQIFERKIVNFQGIKVTLNNIFMKKNLELLTSDEIINLVKDEFILGKPISEYQQDGYISRNIQIPCISDNIFEMPVRGNESFVVAIESLKNPEDFISSESIYTVEELIYLNTDYFQSLNNCYFVILKYGKEDEGFERLRESFSNVHWIKEYDNYYVWKKSVGNIEIIKSYYVDYSDNHIITEEDLLKNESLVVITGEPGMGKSFLLKNMAALLKEKYPLKWIVYLELSQYCEFFKSYEVTKENMFQVIVHAMDFKINVPLLNQSFESLENFVFLLDGYDEIGPHTDTVPIIIKFLTMWSCTVYITCRPDSSCLEKTFSVFSHVIQPLGEENKQKLLLQSWRTKEKSRCKLSCLEQDDGESLARHLISLNSIYLNDPDKSFTGNPLHIYMLSEIYDVGSFKMAKAEENVLNVFQLFREYIRKKCEVYYTEKMECNISKLIVKDNLEHLMSDIIELNKKMSADIIFWNEKNISLEDFVKVRKTLYCSVKVGIFKETQSIYPDGMLPQYNHRLFIEYFAALWLADNYKQNVQLIKKIISQNKLVMVKKFYDLYFSQSNSFITAILTADVVYVENNIENFSVLNSKDIMGRTALHLTASINDAEMTQKLLHHHVDMTIKDDIGWTALEYAIHSHSWEALDLMLLHCDHTEHESKLLWKTVKIYENDLIFLCCKKELPQLFRFVYENVNLNKEFPLPESKCLQYDTVPISIFNEYFELYETYIPIHVAAKYNQINTIQKLQQKGCDIKKRDKKGFTLLHIASFLGHMDLLKYLINEGIPVNCTNHDNNTPLHMACISGQATVIKELVKNGAQVNFENLDCNTPFLMCCRLCDVNVMKYLVDCHADINHSNKYGETAAIMAVKWKNIEVFKYCVESCNNINHPDQYGNTVMFYVCCDHDLDLVKFCVDYHADLYHTNNNGDTVLTYASDNATLETIKYCVEETGLLNHSNNDGNNILFTASEAGRLDIVEYCVDKGADLLHVNNYGNTVLFHALRCTDSKKEFDVVKYLVDCGADINFINREGRTPLLEALIDGKLKIAEYLRQCEANLNYIDNDGNTALMYVAKYGNLKTFMYCHEHFTRINHINNDGDTALLLALAEEHLDIAWYCLQHSANCNHVNNNGDTPLLIAARIGNLEFVKYFHEHFGDLSHSNNNGDTALSLALKNGCKEIVDYCIDHSANPEDYPVFLFYN